jgi:hypothetical protein
VTGWAGGGMIMSGARRAAGALLRDEPGRELPRRLAAGRVLALAAVRGLAGLDLPALTPGLAELALTLPGLAEPDLAEAGLAAPAFAVLDFAVLDLPALTLDLAVLDLAEVPDFARDLLADGRAVLALAVLALAAVTRDAGLPAEDFAAADFAEDFADDVADLRADGRLAVPAFGADRLAAGRRAGVAEAAGLAADIELAAELSALAAAVIALVALFTDCMAVDSVRADDVALVAAAVILVAAEVTLVAADETVRAAVAGVEPADEARLLGRAADTGPVMEPVPVTVPPVTVRRVLAVRVDFLAVLRAGDLLPAGRAVALVVGRAAERCEALVLTDRALAERAGLRPAAARAVVCTGTDFPPWLINYASAIPRGTAPYTLRNQ